MICEYPHFKKPPYSYVVPVNHMLMMILFNSIWWMKSSHWILRVCGSWPCKWFTKRVVKWYNRSVHRFARQRITDRCRLVSNRLDTQPVTPKNEATAALAVWLMFRQVACWIHAAWSHGQNTHGISMKKNEKKAGSWRLSCCHKQPINQPSKQPTWHPRPTTQPTHDEPLAQLFPGLRRRNGAFPLPTLAKQWWFSQIIYENWNLSCFLDFLNCFF